MSNNSVSPLQVTLVKEYCQGPNAVCYNLPTGGLDPTKHSSVEQCARAELSEEASRGGTTCKWLQACADMAISDPHSLSTPRFSLQDGRQAPLGVVIINYDS